MMMLSLDLTCSVLIGWNLTAVFLCNEIKVELTLKPGHAMKSTCCNLYINLSW